MFGRGYLYDGETMMYMLPTCPPRVSRGFKNVLRFNFKLNLLANELEFE